MALGSQGARGSGVRAFTMPEMESGPGPFLRGDPSMSDHRALAHSDHPRSVIAVALGGWIAAAACSMVPADAPDPGGSPSHAERPVVDAPPAPGTAPAQEPASPAAARAQEPAPSAEAPAPVAERAFREGDYFLEAGLGQTFGPGTFLLSATFGRFVDPHLAIGPTLQLGVDDDETIFAPTFGVRRTFDLDDADLRKIEPYVEGGVGLAYLEDDRRGGDDDDVGILLNLGFGANVELQRNLALGTGVLVNLMPGEVLDERLFVSWRIFQLQFAF